MAVMAPQNVGHLHYWTVELTRSASRDEVLAAFSGNSRIAFIRASEDVRYIGASEAQVTAAIPGMAAWLRHVFGVMGGFMISSGVLTLFLAVRAVVERRDGTGTALLVAGLASVATMSWTNFAIDSGFKWLLLGPALLWFAGLVLYAVQGRQSR